MFVIRNIGNQFDTAQGSIEYGVVQLHTPVLMFIGHSNCGAIKAVMDKKTADSNCQNFDIESDIMKELESIVDYKERCEYKEIVPSKPLNENVKNNVINQVNDAKKFFKTLIDSKQLVIIGAVYDFVNSENKGYGKLVEIIRVDE